MAAATTVLQPTTTAATTAAKPQPPVGVQVGLTAPDFTAKLVNGENITLSQLRGKAVLINFWSVY
jgi:cytochrome oxidase Cu insertion factor (SCO1/SenC/PrrC family)